MGILASEFAQSSAGRTSEVAALAAATAVGAAGPLEPGFGIFGRADLSAPRGGKWYVVKLPFFGPLEKATTGVAAEGWSSAIGGPDPERGLSSKARAAESRDSGGRGDWPCRESLGVAGVREEGTERAPWPRAESVGDVCAADRREVRKATGGRCAHAGSQDVSDPLVTTWPPRARKNEKEPRALGGGTWAPGGWERMAPSAGCAWRCHAFG